MFSRNVWDNAEYPCNRQLYYENVFNSDKHNYKLFLEVCNNVQKTGINIICSQDSIVTFKEVKLILNHNKS